jgi:hypothetical protein
MASSNDAIVCDRAKLTCFLLQKAANVDTLLVKSSTHSRRSGPRSGPFHLNSGLAARSVVKTTETRTENAIDSIRSDRRGGNPCLGGSDSLKSKDSAGTRGKKPQIKIRN